MTFSAWFPAGAETDRHGFITRDLYACTSAHRDRCFYCLGSMGSVLPMALGVALSHPSLQVLALEGDGSLLMNLGALVTIARYGPKNLVLVIFDNRQYESSGGQPSQPAELDIANICRATGLETRVATSLAEADDAFRDQGESKSEKSFVLVARIAPGPAQPRVEESPPIIAARFAAFLEKERLSSGEENHAQL
jgi:thiamine pyrophosphate-dependent acetolactate synthase large subunit-like protein